MTAGRPQKPILTREPLVRETLELAQKLGYSRTKLHWISGVERQTIQQWSDGRAPLLPNLVAVLNTMGYELVIRKMDDGKAEEAR